MKKIVSLLALSLILVSCGGVKVAYDYDEQADFSTLKTYNYIPDMQSGLSQLDLNRLMNATDAILQEQGYALSDNPDFLINVMSDRYEERANNNVGIGIGGGSGGVGVGIGGGIPIGGTKMRQQITMDVVDADKDVLIWQADAVGTLPTSTTPEQRIAFFTKVATKILEGFPPGR
ncbi:MAG: hypothetical protein CL868_04720 [Cytophagaceae bacterium]|nr:hypothetical protein [Cytophagaceae bacterium]|tara:strand:- start:191 stop:715 length:525 start_codon:yes stop_codon:yes gene_type:complete